MSDTPLLQLRGITKRFRGVTALSGVDFTVRAGEIHALMGENGAGKSTLIKVLTGVHAPDEGTIALAGRRLAPASPKDAEAAGISTVYQEVNLIPSLSVAENIGLGRQPGRFGFIHWRALRRHARAALARLEIECDVDVELGSLSVALQQMVAIARALDLQARLLVLDEPTASLDDKEVAELFAIMRQLRTQGLGIVFVTHFLDQVYAVSDRITVLRNGQLVGDYAATALPQLQLVSAMLGHEVKDEAGRTDAPAAAAATGAPLLDASGLARRGAVQPVSFSLHRGEVTGLAGLLGSGRTETARLLFGIDAPDAGTLRRDGAPVRIASPRDAVRLGFAFCSEDRKTEGILPNLSVRENLIVALQAKQGLWRTLSRAEQEKLCAHYIAALRIKTADAETPIRNLSGGNQQKVLLARWLATRPELIILDEPTRGIDVGAKAEIEALVEQLRAQGLSVLLISSEIESIVRTCGRVLVMRERRLAGEVPAGADLTTARLMRVMSGHE
ncbi:sugar ABC transporter ATP-binding protein [Oleiharenicola sp. Vm1]|uniref:sugar ABC transporter ATP-binding protein n=1 Tax=Oleiharenicola sp. Vm1 TaxID=3398393 RepID=UPI0039F55256